MMQAAPPTQFQEGQRVRGPNGEIGIVQGGQIVVQPAAGGLTTPALVDPRLPTQTQREQVGLQGDQYRVSNQPVDDRFSRENMLRQQFTQLPEVRRYTEVVPLYISARNAADTRAGDLNLIYAFGKMMDPGSVVREGELTLVQGTSTIAERLRALISSELEGTGRLSAATRRNLLSELRSRRLELARSYANAREQFSTAAQEYGLDPSRVVGEHPAQRYADEEAAARAARQQQAPQHGGESPTPFAGGAPGYRMGPNGLEVDVEGGTRGPPDDDPIQVGYDSNGEPQATPGSFNDSLLSQGLSGVNEGIASTLGLPVDLAESALNLIPAGIDAIANTHLPRLQNSFGGSSTWRDLLTGIHSIGPESADSTNQFLRRVGQSVGAAAIPVAGAGGTVARMGAGFLTAAGGGVGAATAREVFPGNPIAELGGEIIGSGGTGAGLFGLARRGARSAAEAGVPSIDELREQASGLYRQAESRGVVAGPNVTADLAGRLRTIARDAEVVDETGAVSPMYPHAGEALRVIDRYAGQNLNPTQIQVIREGLTDAVRSTEGRQRNVARDMLGAFDEVTVPVAPELAEARRVASRYLQAGTLEQTRELAGNRASQFTGSGFENALRTQYRGLSNRVTKGQEQFHPDVVAAIQDVTRGTPLSNTARNVGRFAPTGPVSSLLAAGPVYYAGSSVGGPLLGAAAAGTMAGVGHIGRALATSLGIRNADVAELLARNGGALTPEPVIDPELLRMIAALSVTQSADAGGPR